MKALVFDKELTFETSVPMPVRKKGEALIKVTLSGICRTDIEITRGYMHYHGIPGHEFVGVVEESDNQNLVGKRVTGDINCACGHCSMCRMGRHKHCYNRTTLGIFGRNGTFAEYIVLPDKNLYVIPDNLSDEEAVFVEPLAAAYEIPQSIHIHPVNRILVIGAGKLGALIAQVLKKTSCHMDVLAKYDYQAEFLRDCGIKTTPPDKLPEGELYDYAVECSGVPACFDLASAHIHPRGTLIMKSTYHDNIEVNISALVVNEIRMIGSRCGPFEPALRSLADGSVKVKPLIAETFSIDDGLIAFDHAVKGARGKVLIKA
ncbi:MAG: alcohol dehydrogenase catalytic domain-containing protein [Firmicutes bacterium]|nr:alcohol dehydrogenase catalytic domain-containing protein [Bacillota bacterium]